MIIIVKFFVFLAFSKHHVPTITFQRIIQLMDTTQLLPFAKMAVCVSGLKIELLMLALIDLCGSDSLSLPDCYLRFCQQQSGMDTIFSCEQTGLIDCYYYLNNNFQYLNTLIRISITPFYLHIFSQHLNNDTKNLLLEVLCYIQKTP